MPTYPRHPLAMAQQALSTQAATRGRLALGIGPSHPVVIEGMHGLEYTSPARHTREYVEVLRAAFAVHRQPSSITASSSTSRRCSKCRARRPAPILVAALAPQMLKLAGEVADGTITYWANERALTEHIVPRITRAGGGAQAGRRRASSWACRSRSATIPTPARERAARLFGAYNAIPTYQRIMARGGDAAPEDDRDHRHRVGGRRATARVRRCGRHRPVRRAAGPRRRLRRIVRPHAGPPRVGWRPRSDTAMRRSGNVRRHRPRERDAGEGREHRAARRAAGGGEGRHQRARFRHRRGNPTWKATHPPATRNARSVQQLLDAGATLVGKGVRAELAYSLSGDNVHYGMPPNPAALDRNPGGSTSGPASAVAAGACRRRARDRHARVDPRSASYCGLFGFRPTFGTISVDGVRPLAPSFDTVGVLARSAAVLAAAGDVLLALRPAEPSRGASSSSTRTPSTSTPRSTRSSPSRATRCGASTATGCARDDPDLGPGVAERIAHAATVTREQALAAQRVRAGIVAAGFSGSSGTARCSRCRRWARHRCVTQVPTALQAARVAAGRVSSLASLAGLPAVSVPSRSVAARRVGRELVAAPGADRVLLRACVEGVS